MKFKALFLAVSASLALSACGGSSNDKPVASKEQQSTTASTTTTTTKPEPEKPTPVFSIAATLGNACSDESAAVLADVIFHNVSGKVISSVKTGSDGKLAQALPENTHHVTLVAKDTSSIPMTTQLFTLLDVANTDYGTIEFNQQQVCDSQRKEVDPSALAASQPDYYISGLIGSDISVKDLGPDNSYLYPESKNTILHISNEDYSDVRGGLFNLEGEAPIELTDEAFASPGVRVNIADLPFSKIDSVNSRVSLASFDDNEQISTQLIFGPDYRHKYIFPELATTSYAYNSVTERASLPGFDMFTKSATFHDIDNNGQPRETAPLLYDTALQNAFTQFAQSMAQQSNGNLFEYDFSGVDDRINLVAITLRWEDVINGEVRWEVVSKPQAAIPDFEFGTAINTNVDTVEGFELNLDVTALNFTGGFDALRQEFQKAAAGNIYIDTSLLKGAAVYSFDIEVSE
ncbi:hypothetical protein [Pseudoalteromonas rubra]|uniref:Uncharacterized protein n=1 Tax=Pseudoalteromonas rubra TaxID=43658 RepID=A0A0F4QR81_9GAMM|nr:hypothetical protein [Pseudoalteromonas rubra]KJZ09869.1 hypothetical protein TW77_08740 [Pseudoalteromonas rubra]